MRTCLCVVHCSAKEDEKSFIQTNVCPLEWELKNSRQKNMDKHSSFPLLLSFHLLGMHQSLIYNIQGISLEEYTVKKLGSMTVKVPKKHISTEERAEDKHLHALSEALSGDTDLSLKLSISKLELRTVWAHNIY